MSMTFLSDWIKIFIKESASRDLCDFLALTAVNPAQNTALHQPQNSKTRSRQKNAKCMAGGIADRGRFGFRRKSSNEFFEK